MEDKKKLLAIGLVVVAVIALAVVFLKPGTTGENSGAAISDIQKEMNSGVPKDLPKPSREDIEKDLKGNNRG